MRIFNRILICITAGLIMLNTTSCKKDDTLRYGNVTMGNLVDGKFISDQGNTFNMVEMNTTVDLKKFRRGIMQCDVLRETGEKEYDVRVTYMDTVFTKAPVLASIAAEDEEMMVEDPIYIDQRWISGGYLNMYIIFEIQVNPILKDSKHMINLVADDSAAETGKYTFTLRHNAFGETFKGTEKEDSGEVGVVSLSSSQISWGFAGCYVSFPISELITDNNAEVTLNWKSHVVTGNSWSSAIEDKTYKFNYSKDYFEHAPLNIKSKTVTATVE